METLKTTKSKKKKKNSRKVKAKDAKNLKELGKNSSKNKSSQLSKTSNNTKNNKDMASTATATQETVKKSNDISTKAKESNANKNSKQKDAEKVTAKKDAAKNLDELFEDGLKDIYWAEKALLKELPKMQKNATSKELQKAIEGHITETEEQITRLEACFEELGKKAQGKKCDAMQGLLDEAKDIMEESQIGSVRDAGIIAASQKVEHYEIATYGTLAAFAKVLGHKKSLKHLLATLEEEKACDEKLTSIADTNLNSDAK